MSEAGRNTEQLLFSGNYAKNMEQVVMPSLQRHRRDQTIRGEGDKPLFVSRFDAENPRGTVAVVHGFTENVEKYGELIYSLLQHGWSVLAYDQRGHGRSWRDESVQDLSLTHVEHFEEYVRDLEILCAEVLSAMPEPYVLFAHSMGGAVAAMFLERHGEVFKKAVLSSPMIAPNLGGMPPVMVKLMCRTAIQRGKGRERVFISRPYHGPEAFENSCATGRERFMWYEALREKTPMFQNNGPTYGWTLESLQVTEKLLAPGAVEKIQIPVRIYSAEEDGSVTQKDQEKFAARLKNGCRSIVPGSRHEIYRSPDQVLFPWWHEVLSFLEDHKAGAAPAQTE